ncbi:PAS domain-containing protein [Pallidibacillus thermolactis]|jgi:PAS domain S-box-containing protein|uniref:PAS domain-containing protein n=1 Tax=Pallidibacillus thermolactis TaxID=251051 RepID=UPI0021D86833|nr:PAS domain-containing protein [Pallidibacillus thermolactis]MCU9599694.1 PAS domain-containing protein [Pallidibacillus thermolactis subsp. kokeshiiformis]
MIHSSFDGSVKNDGKTNKIVESNLFDHSLFKFNPDMVIFLNMNGNIVHINHGFVKALGYTLQEIILTPFERFFPSSEIAHYQKLFTQATAGEVLCAHMTLLQKNGETCSVSLNMIPAKFHDQIMGIFVTAKDNTNLIKTEKMLAECELKFSSIVDEALTGVYIVNENGKVTYGNKAFYNILGIENHHSTINFRDYVHPEDIPHLNDVSNSLTHAEKGLTHSFRMHRKDGAVIYVESHAQIITLQHKPHIVGTLQDITERKKIEELHEYFADHDYLTELPFVNVLDLLSLH